MIIIQLNQTKAVSDQTRLDGKTSKISYIILHNNYLGMVLLPIKFQKKFTT